MHTLPLIAVTSGDPAGIGPEITARLFSGFRSIGAVRAARAEAAAAKAQTAFQEAQAIREVRKAYREVAAAGARLEREMRTRPFILAGLFVALLLSYLNQGNNVREFVLRNQLIPLVFR